MNISQTRVNDFTFQSYENLLNLLSDNGYAFASYHDYRNDVNTCILRHDIDFDVRKALTLAKLEHQHGVRSTYFVLLSTNFYNVFSKETQAEISQLQSLGHEIGLHFDEARYENLTADTFVDTVKKECFLLNQAIGTPIKTVSMHCPTQKTLNADYKFECTPSGGGSE